MSRVAKGTFPAQISDTKPGEIQYPPSALSHRIIVPFYTQCAGVWKDYSYSLLCDSDKFTKQ